MSKPNNGKRPNYKKGRTDRKPKKSTETKAYNRDNTYDTYVSGQISGGENDFNWYNKVPGVLDNVANLYYSQAAGTKINYPANLNQSTTDGSHLYATPGIMTIKYIQCPGICDNRESAMNVAVTKLYSAIRKLNANSIPYDPADLGIYLYGVMNVHATIAHAMRLYGILRVFNYANSYYPRKLFEAMGYDYDSFVKNQPYFRSIINTVINAINSRVIPGDYSLLERYVWMNKHLFIDSGNTKGQIYAYVPDGYYEFEPFTDERGGKLVYKTFGDNVTCTQFCDILMRQASMLTNDNDFRMISGDIAKTFESAQLAMWNPMASDYTVEMIHGTEILSQIENATIAPLEFYVSAFNNKSLDITQVDGYLHYAPYADAGLVGMDNYVPDYKFPMFKWFNNQHMDNPQVKESTVSTRLTTLWKRRPVAGGNDQIYISTCGSEWITSAVIHTFQTTYGPVIVDNMINATSLTQGEAQELTLRSVFDWAPLAILYVVSGNSANGIGVMGDLDNWIYVEEEVLDRIHRAALWSELTNNSAGVFK